jgi:membrane protease YdiL (CAAX protease family)
MTTVHPRRISRPVLLTPNSLLLATASLGAAAALDGRPVLSLTAFGAVLLWGLHEVRSTSPRLRLRGHAATLVALGAVTAMSMPEFLSPPLDQLLVLSLSALPLLWLCLTAPTVRQVLRLRRRPGHDGLLLVGGFLVALTVASPLVANQQSADPADLVAVAALVVAVPIYDEAVYRGLLMAAVGDSTPAVLGVALVQGLAIAPAFGLRGLLVATALGILLGFVRQVTGRWQSSLSVHWGIALGVAAPLLTVVRVVS